MNWLVYLIQMSSKAFFERPPGMRTTSFHVGRCRGQNSFESLKNTK